MSEYKIGEVYKVTDTFQVTAFGKQMWRDGFYKLIGFSQAGYPVFEDDNKFFEASKHIIEPLKGDK
jgi:hypothetical protein